MNPGDGTVTMNPDGSYTFTPADGFSGETEFTYSVCDDGTPALCDTATVYLEVLDPISVTSNQVIANPDANTVNQDSTGTGNVLANDLDPDGLSPAVTTPLTNQTVSGVDEDGNPVANAGTLTLNTDGTYTFEPASGFTGTVTQAYTICDAAIPAIACDDAELIIDVIPSSGNTTFANDDAVMTDAGVTVSGDIATNDTDNENDTQTINSFSYDTDGDGDADFTVTSGSLGSPIEVGGTDSLGNYVANAGDLTLNADGTYDFEPASGFAGNVVIPYETCDDGTPQACEEATLVITVIDIKRDYGDAPVAYPVAWHRKMTDDNSDNVLDGATDVWLGTNTSFETSQPSSALANGDSNDDAITFGTDTGDFPSEIIPGTSYDVDIIVNSSVADEVYYGLWIDWDNNGSYDSLYLGSQVTASPATATVTVNAPSTLAPGTDVNIRLRADDEPLSPTDFQGGKSNGEVEDYQSMPLVLPVELTSFKGELDDCDIHLNWVTESEKDFDYFELQWSGNGIDFSRVAIIEAEGGDFSQSYKYIEKATSKHNYFRLKMVDLDESVEYSDIIYITSQCENPYEMNVYPNPVLRESTMINVEFYSEREEAYLLITDMYGRVVRKLKLEVESKFINTVQFDISDLPSGNYTIQVLGDNNIKMFTISN